MPKRENPFGESSPLQLKSHVSVKDVERTQARAMNSVYEKTKALLFEGSRKTEKCEDVTLDDLNIPRQQALQPMPGQLMLNNNCGISGKVEMTENAPESSSNVAMETEASEAELLPGQTFIDSLGQIQRNNVDRAASSNSPTRKEALVSCSLCRRSAPHKMHACNDCGRDICMFCVHQCYVCENPFCRFCANNNAEDYLERVICHSCKQNHLH